MSAAKILIVDDDTDFTDAITILLQSKFNLHTEAASDPFEAAHLLIERHFHLVVVDYLLQGWTGIQTVVNVDKQIDEQHLALDSGDRSQLLLCTAAKIPVDDVKRVHGLHHFSFEGLVRKTGSLFALAASIASTVKDEPAFGLQKT